MIDVGVVASRKKHDWHNWSAFIFGSSDILQKIVEQDVLGAGDLGRLCQVDRRIRNVVDQTLLPYANFSLTTPAGTSVYQLSNILFPIKLQLNRFLSVMTKQQKLHCLSLISAHKELNLYSDGDGELKALIRALSHRVRQKVTFIVGELRSIKIKCGGADRDKPVTFTFFGLKKSPPGGMESFPWFVAFNESKVDSTTQYVSVTGVFDPDNSISLLQGGRVIISLLSSGFPELRSITFSWSGDSQSQCVGDDFQGEFPLRLANDGLRILPPENMLCVCTLRTNSGFAWWENVTFDADGNFKQNLLGAFTRIKEDQVICSWQNITFDQFGLFDCGESCNHKKEYPNGRVEEWQGLVLVNGEFKETFVGSYTLSFRSQISVVKLENVVFSSQELEIKVIGPAESGIRMTGYRRDGDDLIQESSEHISSVAALKETEVGKQLQYLDLE